MSTTLPGAAQRSGRLPLVLLFGQAVLGLVVGVVWWAVTRHPATWMVGEPVVTSTSVYPIARDGVFSVLTGLVGLAAGIVLVARIPARVVVSFVVAVLGASAGSLIAAGLGSTLPPSDVEDAAHVTLHAWIALLVQPAVLSSTCAVVSLVRTLADWVREPR